MRELRHQANTELPGHTDERITETVYRRVGEIVKPTR